MRSGRFVLVLCATLAVTGCGDDNREVVAVAPLTQSTGADSSKVAAVAPLTGDSAADQAVETNAAAHDSKKIDSAGEAIYGHYCAGCHDSGPGHPGTMRLDVRLGLDGSVLRERQDLVPEYVKIVVRNGFQMMPAFRPTEITDLELDQLAAYVTSNKPDSKAANAQ